MKFTSFNDDDLKQLKEDIRQKAKRGASCLEMRALVARLEAAERMYLIIESKMSIPEKQQAHIVNEWRKAAGR